MCNMTTISVESENLQFLKQALAEACQSPPKPTNFRVGCVIVSRTAHSEPSIISSGYTLELEGNTHAEQCALSKLASAHNIPETELSSILTESVNATLYTTLEPCGKRLSGNKPCVQRIIDTRKQDSRGGIRKVVFGAKEPGTFVQDSQSCQLLTEAGVEWEYVAGLENEILKVAMEGHEQKKDGVKPEQQQENAKKEKGVDDGQSTNIDDISTEERKRQEAQPRNPKKRMMEAPPDTS
jgi:pyrimidine deaminase RibD-like protein